jgi:hypothetical protein
MKKVLLITMMLICGMTFAMAQNEVGKLSSLQIH